MNYYTGVGSRNTPHNILILIEKIAYKMFTKGLCLRTGDAFGADMHFNIGAKTLKEIYTANDCTDEAINISKQYHPVWYKLSPFAKKLHGRNAFQVLGKSLDIPSKCLICWTSDGCESHRYRNIETGGTGTAISIADAYNVKIYNLQLEHNMLLFSKWTNNL